MLGKSSEVSSADLTASSSDFDSVCGCTLVLKVTVGKLVLEVSTAV
jgi:hypothetical protein